MNLYFRKCFYFLVLAMAGVVSHPGARAGAPITLSVAKLDFYFETFVRIQVKGMVVESEEAKLLGTNASYTQSLTYVGRGNRDAGRTFANLIDLRRWMETELCAETHEVDLRPVRESGVRGDQSFRGRLRPLMVKASGKEITEREGSLKERALDETLICKRKPKSES